MNSSKRNSERKSTKDDCEIRRQLALEFLKVQSEQSKDDHCCTPDECCEGMGKYGEDCCNEDGANGHCFCGEEPVRTKKQDREWTEAYDKMSTHEKDCKTCKGEIMIITAVKPSHRGISNGRT